MTKNGKLRIRSYLIIFGFSEEIDSLRPTVTNYLPCSILMIILLVLVLSANLATANKIGPSKTFSTFI